MSPELRSDCRHVSEPMRAVVNTVTTAFLRVLVTEQFSELDDLRKQVDGAFAFHSLFELFPLTVRLKINAVHAAMLHASVGKKGRIHIKNKRLMLQIINNKLSCLSRLLTACHVRTGTCHDRAPGPRRNRSSEAARWD